MRKGSRIAFALFLIVALAGLALLTLRAHEPMYEGRPMSFWLGGYDYTTPSGTSQQQADKLLTFWLAGHNHAARTGSSPQKADEAMNAIGTNAIPTLLRMLQTTDSPLKQRLITLAKKQSIFPIHIRADYEYRLLAAEGFYGLGPNGKMAVPTLMGFLKATNEDVRLCAADCLGNIGPSAKEAVPFFVQMLNDTNGFSRFGAAINLGRIHSQPELAVPALITNLYASDRTWAAVTIRALGEFGSDAKPAIPHFVQFLKGNDAFLRSQAINAIQRIDTNMVVNISGDKKNETN